MEKHRFDKETYDALVKVHQALGVLEARYELNKTEMCKKAIEGLKEVSDFLRRKLGWSKTKLKEVL